MCASNRKYTFVPCNKWKNIIPESLYIFLANFWSIWKTTLGHKFKKKNSYWKRIQLYINKYIEYRAPKLWDYNKNIEIKSSFLGTLSAMQPSMRVITLLQNGIILLWIKMIHWIAVSILKNQRKVFRVKPQVKEAEKENRQV